jgi:hypothetical protein
VSEVSFDTSNLNCNDPYQHAPHVTYINVVNLTGPFSFTVRIPSGFLPPGAGQYEACIGSIHQFTTINGTPASPVTIGTQTYYVGIIPNCSPKPKPDCAHIYKNSGDLIEAIYLTGDMIHH